MSKDFGVDARSLNGLNLWMNEKLVHLLPEKFNKLVVKIRIWEHLLVENNELFCFSKCATHHPHCFHFVSKICDGRHGLVLDETLHARDLLVALVWGFVQFQ